ncbi:hypothetical protein BEH_07645 [Priestia filamentosa]|uniref:Uncharacterized protein n=1 Tax=Priestia filamentosa TaxID=1402861 RepID=A0A0H4KUK9_9BACI|nr:hypothetical protein [Priestia filamentosa]AKO91983.1 hypothetical protein BEH_07645 [Priestia filamentosa]
MNIIYDDYEGDQLSLILAFNEPQELFIGHLETPMTSDSLVKCLEWEKGITHNLICLSDDLEPQSIKHSMINEVVPVKSILEEVEKELEYKIKYNYWLNEVKSYSFHEVLHTLLGISLLKDKRMQLFTAKEVVREHFRKVIDTEVNKKCAK